MNWHDHKRPLGTVILDAVIMVVLLTDMWVQKRCKR